MKKYCKKCKNKKDVSEFGKNKSNKDGLSDRCKECEKQRAIEYRLKNPLGKLWPMAYRSYNATLLSEYRRRYNNV